MANEQVDTNGKSWRSGAIVEKKKLKQWFLGITRYANKLDEDLNLLNGWPEKVKTMQKNWIGMSKGSEIKFSIEGIKDKYISIFTTRIDTILGVTYLVVSSEHELVDLLVKENQKQSTCSTVVASS